MLGDPGKGFIYAMNAFDKTRPAVSITIAPEDEKKFLGGNRINVRGVLLLSGVPRRGEMPPLPLK